MPKLIIAIVSLAFLASEAALNAKNQVVGDQLGSQSLETANMNSSRARKGVLGGN